MYDPGNLPGKPRRLIQLDYVSDKSVPPEICTHTIEKVSHFLKSLGMRMLHRSPIPLARRGTASAPPQLFMSDPTLTEFLG